MSSNTYSACLKPDRRLRIIVIATGRLLGVVGLLVIVSCRWQRGCAWLPVPFGPAYPCRAAPASSGYRRYELDSTAGRRRGALCNRDQEWVPARLQNGSVLLRTICLAAVPIGRWQSIRGTHLGDGRQCQQWRRLQVIWRHIGALG